MESNPGLKLSRISRTPEECQRHIYSQCDGHADGNIHSELCISVSMVKSWLPSSSNVDVYPSTHSNSTTDPDDHFEVTVWDSECMWQFKSPTSTDSKTVPYDNFTDQRHVKADKMYLTTEQVLACVQLHLEVNCNTAIGTGWKTKCVDKSTVVNHVVYEVQERNKKSAVHETTLTWICRSANKSSTRVRSTLVIPAWWMAKPYGSKSFNSADFTCSDSCRRTSVEAEPSLKKMPKVSFSRHMSRIARAVLPVSLREWTKMSTWFLPACCITCHHKK